MAFSSVLLLNRHFLPNFCEISTSAKDELLRMSFIGAGGPSEDARAGGLPSLAGRMRLKAAKTSQ